MNNGQAECKDRRYIYWARERKGERAVFISTQNHAVPLTLSDLVSGFDFRTSQLIRRVGGLF